MLGARPVILHGLVWRVGDRRDINIWGDRWLPTPISFVVQSPPKILLVDVKVSSLIDQDTKRWNKNLITAVFMEKEAQLICNIPLSPLQSQDKLIWRCIKNGQFSVRSAYCMEKELQAFHKSGCSQFNAGIDVWKVIWSLQVPNVNKMFL
jgi:hypothetical protein